MEEQFHSMRRVWTTGDRLRMRQGAAHQKHIIAFFEQNKAGTVHPLISAQVIDYGYDGLFHNFMLIYAKVKKTA